MKVVCLSAGHNDNDPGAIYKGLVERDLVEKIVGHASEILRSHGVGVLNPPPSLNLSGTVRWINDRKDQPIDICCEIHINSSSKPNQGVGLEGWHYRNSNESKNFAQFLVDGCAVESGMKKDRGVKDEKYHRWGKLRFVHDTIPLACLIECGFINTDEDRAILSTDTGLYNMAKGVARGVVEYLGLNWTPQKPSKPQESKELLKIRGELAECKKECQRLKDRLVKISALSRL